jgi:hypothetical protein
MTLFLMADPIERLCDYSCSTLILRTYQRRIFRTTILEREKIVLIKISLARYSLALTQRCSRQKHLALPGCGPNSLSLLYKSTRNVVLKISGNQLRSSVIIISSYRLSVHSDSTFSRKGPIFSAHLLDTIVSRSCPTS